MVTTYRVLKLKVHYELLAILDGHLRWVCTSGFKSIFVLGFGRVLWLDSPAAARKVLTEFDSIHIKMDLCLPGTAPSFLHNCFRVE